MEGNRTIFELRTRRIGALMRLCGGFSKRLQASKIFRAVETPLKHRGWHIVDSMSTQLSDLMVSHPSIFASNSRLIRAILWKLHC